MQVPGDLELPVVDDTCHPVRERRVILAVDRQRRPEVAGQLRQDGCHDHARRALPLDHRNQAIG